MKRFFEKGDLVSYEVNKKRVTATVSHVWKSRKSLHLRTMGKSQKVEVPISEVKRIL